MKHDQKSNMLQILHAESAVKGYPVSGPDWAMWRPDAFTLEIFDSATHMTARKSWNDGKYASY